MDATLDPVSRGTRSRGTLLLADISGYTGFLQGVAEAHYELIVEADAPPPAYGLVASLLDGIVEAIVPPFRLVKFEGDAVFVVVDEGDGPAAIAALGIPAEDMVATTETYERVPPIPVHVLPLA